MATRYIQGVNKVQASNDGVASPTGYIGETIAWQGSTATNLANGSGYQKVGGANSKIVLNKGVYLLSVTGSGAPSTASMRVLSYFNVDAGAATGSHLGTQDCTYAMDSSGNGGFWVRVTTVTVTSDNTSISLQANPAGGTFNSSVVTGGAVRIA